ncbi:siderophore-interacting protein [Arhodomonas sp. AD133]|uniref:siderophore-interacting protein n=1 Tax=Arhodomonas sp. AD133 TaxID=3415009 RepID=UPI003EBF16FE
MSGNRHAKATPPRLLEVQWVHRVSPNVLRVGLGGPDLAGFPANRNGAHIKIFLPRDGQAEPVLPRLGPDGPVWPPRDQRPVTRTYSVRRLDPATGLMEVDFVLHGDQGPASAWALRAAPGQRIGVAGPGGPEPMIGSADWYLLAGDITALPAISALLEELSATARGQAIVEVPTNEDCQAPGYAADIPIRWLVRRQPAGVDRQLIDAVEAVDWPRAECFAWIAGENAAVVHIRNSLRRSPGLQRRQMYAVPYWKAEFSEERYHAERHRIMDAFDAEA